MVVYCAPGIKLPEDIRNKLRDANADRKKNDFFWYARQLSNIFELNLDLSKPVTEKEKLFFAGFLTGEGSINVSAKKEENSRSGIMLDPEFSVTQHVNGLSHLFIAFRLFKTGSLRYKSGSNATMVYRIDSRESLKTKLIPFCEQYCSHYWSDVLQERFLIFKKLIAFFEEKAHLNLNDFSKKMLPLWSKMRKQKEQSNASFASLEEAQAYAQDHYEKKYNARGSSETTRDPV